MKGTIEQCRSFFALCWAAGFPAEIAAALAVRCGSAEDIEASAETFTEKPTANDIVGFYVIAYKTNMAHKLAADIVYSAGFSLTEALGALWKAKSIAESEAASQRGELH